MEIKNITKAILQVTKEVKNIEKKMTVGSGTNSYAGVSDSLVRNMLRPEMEKARLVILPVQIVPTIKVDRWDETTQYGTKSKQSVFTEVTTKYILMHQDSGESIELAGYGQGVDSQDKGAGKATTYALKNTLLDLFLLTKGEDTDNTHSEDIPVVPQKFKKVNQDITIEEI